MIEMQRQQLAAIQQQQQQQQRSWSAQKTMMAPQAGAPSLLEIQQEQARQLEEKQRQQKQVVQTQVTKYVLRSQLTMLNSYNFSGHTPLTPYVK